MDNEVLRKTGRSDSLAIRKTLLKAMHYHLHEICQPITALQFQLELGRMQGDSTSLLLEAIAGALSETERLFMRVVTMRAALSEEEEALQRDLVYQEDHQLASGEILGAEVR